MIMRASRNTLVCIFSAQSVGGLTRTSKQGHVGLLGVERAPCQTVDLFSVKLKVIQLAEEKTPTR